MYYDSTASCVTVLSSPLSIRSTFNTGSTKTQLLYGQSFIADDLLHSVHLLINEPQPFYLEVWTPAAGNTFTLKYSKLVYAVMPGYNRFLLGWSVSAGDVLGWTSACDAALSITYDDDDDSARESLVLQFPAHGTATTTLSTSSSTPVHRYYSLSIHTRLSCSLSSYGNRALTGLSNSDAVATTTVLLGQTVPNDAFAYNVQFWASSLNTVQLQVYASVFTLTGPVFSLRYSLSVTPTQLGYNSQKVNWAVQKGDVFAFASTKLQSSCIRYTTDIFNQPSYSVLVYDNTTSTVGATLPGTATSYYRHVDVQFFTRPYGQCLGGASILSGATIGNCSYITGGQWCAYRCNDGYTSSGGVMQCFANSTGALIGAQQCNPNPCHLSLPSTKFAKLGNCSSTLTSGTVCSVVCTGGYLTDNSTVHTCLAGKIITDFQYCYKPGACKLPNTFPLGAAVVNGTCGNCTAGGQLNHTQSCTLKQLRGYEGFGASLTLTCFNRQLSPIPAFLQEPCHLPDILPSQNLVYGGCNASIATNVTCNVTCEYGYNTSSPVTMYCDRGVLNGTLPSCVPISDCYLPNKFPDGTSAGTCDGLDRISVTDGNCTLELEDGYTLANGSLTYSCHLGELHGNPGVIPSNCSLPTLSKHVAWDSCDLTQLLMHGQSCTVKCAGDYITDSSLSLRCSYGALTGGMPKCKLKSCQVPLVLPTGTSAGTCVLGGLLVGDGDGHPASCTLKLEFGYYVSDYSLDLSCSSKGVLSPMPVVVASAFPTLIEGDCVTGPSDWPQQTDVPLYQYAGKRMQYTMVVH